MGNVRDVEAGGADDCPCVSCELTRCDEWEEGGEHTNVALKGLPVCRVYGVLADVGDGAVT